MVFLKHIKKKVLQPFFFANMRFQVKIIATFAMKRWRRYLCSAKKRINFLCFVLAKSYLCKVKNLRNPILRMRKYLFIVFMGLLLSCPLVSAQQVEKSELEQRAESAAKEGSIASTRFLYIKAYEDYFNKGKLSEGVACGCKATALYYKENYYKEAFDLLRRIDQSIVASAKGSQRSALHYYTAKERMQMYMKLHRGASVLEQLNIMEAHANAANDESVSNDLLYNKAIYYYSFGQTAKGNAVFKKMADKLTSQKEYDKVDEVYRTLIANGRKSGSASLVAQSYSSYMAWKDSVTAMKSADEIASLKQHIADNEASIAEKDSSLSSRKAIIAGLCVLAVALAAALAVGAVVLMRFILLSRKQKKTIRLLNDNNALKAKFISNISSQLLPTLQRLDSRQPEVKALLDFSSHVQTLSDLEQKASDDVEMEDLQMQPFCEGLMDKIRSRVKPGVVLSVNAPRMSVRTSRDYVAHIVEHLLANAAEYTPEGGKISLEYKKRSAHTHQLLVTDSGPGIAEERREDVFKAFLEVKDLTTGDGLGLPICKQMAMKMGGDLEIDPDYTKGARFVLTLHA